MITTRQARALKQRIDDFEEAVEVNTVKGSAHPDVVPLIERQLRVARRRLDQYISQLITRYRT